MEEIKKVLLLVLGCAVQVGLLSGWRGFLGASSSLQESLGDGAATVCGARRLEVEAPQARIMSCVLPAAW